MCTETSYHAKRRQLGLTLIETIIFIVIVGVGVTALVRVLGEMNKHSADPMLHKQALAVAESLLEEIMLQPFTICDPNDPVNLTATNASPPAVDGSDCTGGASGANYVAKSPLGSQATAAGKSRNGASQPFNNVSDYAILAPPGSPMVGIQDVNGAAITGLAGYTAIIEIAEITDATTRTALGLTDKSEGLQIDVTVRTPKYVAGSAEGEFVKLTGYRFRYSPVARP